MPPDSPTIAIDPRAYASQRVRHDVVRRMPRVVRTQQLAPRMLRITLGGDDLAGFRSDAYDDHVKLFFPLPGHDTPVMAPSTEGSDDTQRSPMRDFTPRRFDPQANELDIDFALHESGPASDWARRARVGDVLGVGGPRGSMVISDAFDWYLLAGDETALPAIGRRLETAPAGTRMLVLVETATPADRIDLPQRDGVDYTWLYRNAATGKKGLQSPDADGGATRLAHAASQLAFPKGVGHAFGAGEYAAMIALRAVLAQERGMQNFQLRIASYWKRGAEAHHENLEAA